MTYNIDEEEYEDLEEFMEEGDYTLPITVFSEEEIELMNEHNSQGRYIFTLQGPDVDENIEYEFVYAFSYDDTDLDEEKLIPYLVFFPSKLPDEVILKYIDASQYDKDDPSYGFDKTTTWDVEYIPFESDNYQTNDDELISFNGEIRKIQEDDVYIKNDDDGNNYQILPNCQEELEVGGIWMSITHFMDEEYNMNLYHQMKEDNFMGKFVRTFVDNRGYITKEVYVIGLVEKDAIFLENYDVPTYWSNLLPSLIWDKNNIPTLHGRLIYEIYIPYSEEEEII